MKNEFLGVVDGSLVWVSSESLTDKADITGNVSFTHGKGKRRLSKRERCCRCSKLYPLHTLFKSHGGIICRECFRKDSNSRTL